MHVRKDKEWMRLGMSCTVQSVRKEETRQKMKTMKRTMNNVETKQQRRMDGRNGMDGRWAQKLKLNVKYNFNSSRKRNFTFSTHNLRVSTMRSFHGDEVYVCARSDWTTGLEWQRDEWMWIFPLHNTILKRVWIIAVFVVVLRLAVSSLLCFCNYRCFASMK